MMEKLKSKIIIEDYKKNFDYKKNKTKVSDIKLAQNTKNIDLIIGGHTHTFMDKPKVFKNAIQKDVLINQVGCYGLYLGQIDFYLDSKKNISTRKKIISII